MGNEIMYIFNLPCNVPEVEVGSVFFFFFNSQKKII